MRKIEFRGKRVDNGRWVYGYYFKTPLTDEATGSKFEDGWYFLTGRERHCISKDGCVYEVISETIGEYIGFNDRENMKIYEGDIVKNLTDDIVQVIKYDIETARFIIIGDGLVLDFDNTYSKEIEVIGNIYEIQIY